MCEIHPPVASLPALYCYPGPGAGPRVGLPGDADEDGDIGLGDYFFATDPLDSEDAHFDFNANSAVDILDLLEIHQHYGQIRQEPLLVFNPQGPPLADLHIAQSETPGAIRLYFTAQGAPPAWSTSIGNTGPPPVDHQTRGAVHTLDIAAPATEGMRYVAFGYHAGAATSRVLLFAWHFGAQCRALADLDHVLLDNNCITSLAPLAADAETIANLLDRRVTLQLQHKKTDDPASRLPNYSKQFY